MMEYRIEERQIRALKADGTLLETTAECAMLINAIYSMLARQGKAADIFKQAMQIAVTDDSPVWESTPFDGVSMAVLKKNTGRTEP